MAEQPPQLLDQLATSPTGAAWKARQPDGSFVLVTQVLIQDEASREAGLDRLRRLSRIHNPHLARVQGWWADTLGLWWVGDLEQGLGLPDLPGGGYLSPQQAAAISFGLLEGLQALHAEGLNHGALTSESVRILPDGSVKLTGHQLATLRFPTQAELAAELKESGRLVCQAFGISPERDPRAAPRAIEHAAPALVVTARAIAGGNMGSDIGAAESALRDTSGPLGGTERLGLGVSELASLVATRSTGMPAGELRFKSLATPIAPAASQSAFAATPRAPVQAVTAAQAQSAPVPAAASAPTPPRRTWEERNVKPLPHEYEGRRRGPNPLLIGGVLAALLVVALGIYFGRGLLAGSATPFASNPTPSSSGAARSSPSASANSVPGAVPTFAPPAAGAIKSVTLNPGTGCLPGAKCTLNVILKFTVAGNPHDVTWRFKTFDPCSGATTDLDGGTITAQGDWNTTDGNTTVALPAAKGQLAVVALSGPDVAASTPALFGSAGC